jgi:hypothetical protein
VIGRQGKEQLATEGIEGKGTVTRIVTGGAGNYAGWTGEQVQTFLGFNPTGGANLRVTFKLYPPGRSRRTQRMRCGEWASVLRFRAVSSLPPSPCDRSSCTCVPTPSCTSMAGRCRLRSSAGSR